MARGQEVLRDGQLLPELLSLAATAPRIAEDDPRISDDLSHKQYGNNFYLLWHSIQPEFESNDILRQVYGSRLLSWEGWEAFSTANKELLDQIAEGLKAKQPYDQLLDTYTDLVFKAVQEKQDGAEPTSAALAEQLDAAVGHPLGIEAIGVYAWDQLNPFLEEVASRMDAAGIEAKQFFS